MPTITMRIALEAATKRPAAVMRALKGGKRVTLTFNEESVEVLAPESKEARLERLRRHPAIGMWADREDMKDPNEWRRQQRRKRQTRLLGLEGERRNV